MRHRKKKNKLGKASDQREALLKALSIALIKEEKIKTTYRRARSASALIDKLVTLGKKGDIHSRRQVYSVLQDRELVKKLFTDIAPRFNDINGGYTRVIKIKNRRGDNASLAIMEFTRIKEELIEEKRKLKLKRKEKKQKKLKQEVAPPVEEVKVEEEVKEAKPQVKKAKKMPQVEKTPASEKEKKSAEPKKSKKGFLKGLRGFLKRDREK